MCALVEQRLTMTNHILNKKYFGKKKTCGDSLWFAVWHYLFIYFLFFILWFYILSKRRCLHFFLEGLKNQSWLRLLWAKGKEHINLQISIYLIGRICISINQQYHYTYRHSWRFGDILWKQSCLHFLSNIWKKL